MKEIILSDKREDVDFKFVYGFLSERSMWAAGVGRSTQKKALDNSMCISAFIAGKQVGFARVVTDYATYAWIDDVFVDEAAQSQGVSHHLITTILEHRDLKSVASWWLSSSNPVARSLFEKHGFEVPDPKRLGKLMALPKHQGKDYKT